MFLTDQATASSTLPTPAAAGTPGYFTNGNPSSGVAATIVDADWLNMLQLELMSIVTAAGIAPSKTTYNQVLAAIKRVGQSTVVLADTGAVNAYAAVNAVPLVAGGSPTWIDGVVQAVKIAHTNTAASTYAPDGLPAIPIYGLGLQPLQGGELLLNGIAILMRMTIAGVNSGNPICVLMECAGGAQQVAPATASQHAVQFGQLTGTIGSRTNVKGSWAANATSLTLSIDGLIVGTSLTGLQGVVSGTLTLNLATTGAGGMDTGTATASSWLAIYAIKNPTTGAQALLGQIFSLTGSQPTIYGGANMPSGYTMSALVAVVNTVATAGQLGPYSINGRRMSRGTVLAFNTATATSTPTALVLSGALPYAAVRCRGYAVVTSTSTSNIGIALSSDTTGIGTQNISVSGALSQTGNYEVDLQTAQTIYYTSNNSAGTPAYSVYVSSFEI